MSRGRLFPIAQDDYLSKRMSWENQDGKTRTGGNPPVCMCLAEVVAALWLV